MRIALYHNLRAGGALRFLRETVKRSAHVHDYHLYRAVSASSDTGSLPAIEGVSEVIDVLPRLRAAASSRLARPASQRAADLLTLWSAESQIGSLIDDTRYDLCLVHPCWVTQSPSLLRRITTPSLYFAQEARRLSFERPYSARIGRSSLPHHVAVDSGYEQLMRRADRRAMDSATAVACNSFFSAESIYRSYGRTATVIYSGVDAAVFQSGPTVREHYVVSVGALDPIKGHATIVEALSLLPGEQRPALHIAFERHAPDYEMLLRNLANRLGVRIEFHPQLTDAELARLYASAQATICAARLEPFGLTPLESLSCGTPVVAINEGGFRESVTDGCNGALVAANSAGIAAGITAVLEHRISSDPDKLRATVASFTWERTVEELHRMFDVVSLSGTSTAKHGPV